MWFEHCFIQVRELKTVIINNAITILHHHHSSSFILHSLLLSCWGGGKNVNKNKKNKIPSLKLTWHLKMDGWNTIVSFWGPAYFQVRAVSFRQANRPSLFWAIGLWAHYTDPFPAQVGRSKLGWFRIDRREKMPRIIQV